MCLLQDSEEPPSNDSPSVTLLPSKLVREVLLPPLQRAIQLQIDAARGCPDLLEQVRLCACVGESIQFLIIYYFLLIFLVIFFNYY